MKTKLLIIGAGNIGGYIAVNLEDFGAYELLGFLDDDPGKIGKDCFGYPVLGNIASIDRHLGEAPVAVVIGIAAPKAKNKVIALLQPKNVLFPNFIAPSVWLSRKTGLGKGIILYPGVCINYETEIGDFVIMNMNCSIGHNCTFEEGGTLAPGVNFAGFTYVERFADVGIGATTIQGVRIGSFSRVGGQAMLLKTVPEYSTVVGNPARIIRLEIPTDPA